VIVFIAGIIALTPVAPFFRNLLRNLLANPSPKVLPAAMTATFSFAPLAALAGILVLAVLKVAAGTHNPFIYFRF
jgi:alginate O-acetyltransferase complex protein AlgI